MSECIQEAVEAFSQIRDTARAKNLVHVALDEALDYKISWDEFNDIINVIRTWQQT